MASSWKPIDDHVAQAEMRRELCTTIAECAQIQGLAATWEQVNRNFKIWHRWYRGELSLGYVIRLTGVRRIKSDSSDNKPRG
jgi:hypothetical protein